jgi:OST-HTH/LOTUS domain
VKKAPAPPQQIPKEPPTKAIPLVLAAMKSIDRDGEWYHLGQLGQFITKAKPDFDPRTYGSSKLSELLTKTGRFEVKVESGNRLVAREKS